MSRSLCKFLLVTVLFATTIARRYAPMECDIPLGDIKASQETPTACDCGTLCDGVDANALIYDTANRMCQCIDPTGYGTPGSDGAGGTVDGYIAVDDSVQSCPSCEQTQSAIRDWAYPDKFCPPDFGSNLAYGGYYCYHDGLTDEQCAKYSPFHFSGEYYETDPSLNPNPNSCNLQQY